MAAAGGPSAAPAGGAALAAAAAAAGATAGRAGCDPNAPATGSVVKIGNVGTYTGVAGENFQGAPQMLQVWVAWTNAHGGLNCHRIQLFSEEDQGDPSVSVSETKQLLSQGVIAFLADYIPFTVNEVAPVIAQAKIPMIGGDDFSPLDYTTPYIFPTSTSVRYEDTNLAKYFSTKGMTKVAEWWCIEAEVCVTARVSDADHGGLAAGGAQVMQNTGVSLTAPSFTAQCEQAKQSGVQWIMDHVDGASIIRAVQSCNQINYHPTVCNVTNVAIPQMLTTPDVFGHICFPVNNFPWFGQGSTPAQQAYHQAMNQYAPGMPNDSSTAAAWAAGEVLREVSVHFGATPTTAELLQGLYEVKNDTFGGTTFPLTFGPGANASPLCDTFAVVDNGQWAIPPGNPMYCATASPLT